MYHLAFLLMETCAAFTGWRPSSTTNLDRCSLNTQPSSVMYGCWMDCWQDPCCMAVNVTSCEKSYFPTESLDLVKEGVSAGAVEDCSCTVQSGGNGGNSFEHPYTGSPITKILATINESGRLRGIGVEYADGTKTDHDSWSKPMSCSFAPEERITQIKVYVGHYSADFQVDIVYGIEIVSSEKSCGLFGISSSATKLDTVSGHRLLYIAGRKGSVYDQLKWNFDYGCNQVVKGITTLGTDARTPEKDD